MHCPIFQHRILGQARGGEALDRVVVRKQIHIEIIDSFGSLSSLPILMPMPDLGLHWAHKPDGVRRLMEGGAWFVAAECSPIIVVDRLPGT